jgi:DNA-directed RNA polymerase subunit RPC12/RpoP
MERASLGANLSLSRCPYCGIARPLLMARGVEPLITTRDDGGEKRFWRIYVCTTCGGVVVATAEYDNGPVTAHYPFRADLSASIPERPREFLRQASESLSQPAASIMVCASAVDAMLKDKGLKDGTLFHRIDRAASEHLITPDIAKWAHQVRLDANDQRHADEAAPFSTQQDAHRTLLFALALADVLYVIPARVTRGIEESKPVSGTVSLDAVEKAAVRVIKPPTA